MKTEFTIDGNSYRVRFFHVNVERASNHVLASENLQWLKKHRKRALTTCTIDRIVPGMQTCDGMEPDHFYTVSKGEAVCSRTDAFNKATGRALSFKRALEGMLQNENQWYLLGRILVATSQVGQHLVSLGKFPQ